MLGQEFEPPVNASIYKFLQHTMLYYKFFKPPKIMCSAGNDPPFKRTCWKLFLKCDQTNQLKLKKRTSFTF